MRVLIVDDSSDDRLIIGHAFRRDGFEVVEAGDGAEGLRAAAEVRPDVVLLDRKLGAESGIAHLPEFIRVGGATPFPVIIVSAAVYGAIEGEARAAGAAAVFEKSESKDFPASIRKLLAARGILSPEA